MSALALALPLAAEKSGEAAKSGPIGLAIILVLCIACYFLFKSMSKHMRKVREDFPDDGSNAGPARPVRPTRESVARAEIVARRAAAEAGATAVDGRTDGPARLPDHDEAAAEPADGRPEA